MKKYAWLSLILAFIFMGCATTHVAIVEKVPVPTDKPLYGYTEEGVFFLHRALFENAGGETPIVAVESSRFIGRRMELKGDYYIYDVSRDHRDKAGFIRQSEKLPGFQYFFPIAKQKIIPVVLLDRKDWIKEKDLLEKKGVGKIFSTKSVKNLDIQ